MTRFDIQMFSREQLRAQYARNAAQLRECQRRAEAVAPRKYRGWTAKEWAERAEQYEKMARGEIPTPFGKL